MATTAANNFYVTGGTLRQDAPCYVERQADRDLYEGLLAGEYCYVLHARQMGKSSLMVHTTTRLRQEGVAVVNLDLTRLGQNLTVEQWYDGLLGHLGRQLDLEDELDEYWLSQERLSPLQRFLGALEHVVLARCPERLVLFLDEIDAVRSLPFSTDEFFAAIRECYNRRTQEPEFARLVFCLLGVATPSDLIQDTRTTPFNIGRRIELTDFTRAEAAPLAQGLGRDARTGAALLERVLYWTGGHPYLTQRLCRAMAEDQAVSDPAGVDRLCEALFLSPQAQERDDNLLFVRERLLKSEAERASLLDLYAQVWSGKRVRLDDTNQLVSLLRLSGIVRAGEGRSFRSSGPPLIRSSAALRVRNRIYRRVFDREWITQHMPDAELRRQRAAFRRGLWRATAISGVVLAAMAALVLSAVRQARRADRLRQVAEQQRSEARHSHYAAQMNLAQRVWEDGNTGRALELLEPWRPEPGEEELRGFEWRYLWRLCQGDSRSTLPQGGWVDSVAFSPDQRLLAAAGRSSHAVRLWDLSSRRAAASLQGHTGGVGSVAFSPDGKLLASASDDRTLKLWEVSSHRLAATLRGHTGQIRQVVFSHGGRMLASRGMDHTVRLWDVRSRKGVATWRVPPDHRLTSLAFSPDDRMLAVDVTDRSGARSSIKLWDTHVQREIATLVGHEARAWSLAFSPDGELLASASEDSTVGLWDLSRVHAASVRERNGQAIPRLRPLALLRGHRGQASAVAFSPDGKTLASGGQDSTIRLWDVARRRELTTLKGHTRGVWSVAFSPDGRSLASGGDDGTVKLWDTVPRRDTNVFRGHQHGISCVAFSPDGKTVASEGGDGIVKLWDARTLQVRAVLPKLGDLVVCALFSPDGRYLATGSSDQMARLWDVATKRQVARFDGYQDDASWQSLAFSPDGKTLAMGCLDRTVRLHDLSSHRQVAVLSTRLHSPRAVAFSPDGKLLAAGGYGEPVEVWDLPSRQRIASIKGATNSALEFSPDGRLLAMTAGDGVKLWDLTSRRAATTLTGSASSFTFSLAFSPDARTLAVGCYDSTVKLWNPAIQQEVGSLSGHTGPVRVVAFSSDGNTLASGGVDGTVRLWRAAPFAETDGPASARPAAH